MELCARRTAGGCGEPDSHVADAAQHAVVQGVGGDETATRLRHQPYTTRPKRVFACRGLGLGRAAAVSVALLRGEGLLPTSALLAHHSLSDLDTRPAANEQLRQEKDRGPSLTVGIIWLLLSIGSIRARSTVIYSNTFIGWFTVQA